MRFGDRTVAYQFTTEDRNDPEIKNLKTKIAFANKLSREATRNSGKWDRKVNALFRVRLMPRGPRVEAAWSDYRSRRAYDSYLPIRHGKRFDVYIHRDTTAEWMMQREKDTGLTSGQLKRLDREHNALRHTEWEMQKRLRAAGIYSNWNGDGYISRDRRIEELRAKDMPEQYIERML